jgi:cytochrome bd ubiquinol oxidase subunit II
LRDAIAPIWEANHVWLILVVTLLFTAFPSVFAVISTALHVPLFLMLIGIVMRGSAFVFRSQSGSDHAERRWSHVFSMASVITPIFLGVTVGAIASGGIELEAAGQNVSSVWLRPFPLSVGFFTLATFSYLAATYAIFETADRVHRNSFRRKALVSGCVVGALAWTSLYFAHEGAPRLYSGLLERAWSVPFQFLTGLVAVGALASLIFRRYAMARILVAAQATLVILGWAGAQYPYLIYPDLTVAAAAAPTAILRPVLVALLTGAFLLIPSFGYLFFVFKKRQLRPSASDR